MKREEGNAPRREIRKRKGRRGPLMRGLLWGPILLTISACLGKTVPIEGVLLPLSPGRVERVREERTIRVMGNILVNRSSKLGFLSQGVIGGIHVRPGQEVRKGELLAELNTEKDQFNIRLKKEEWERELFSGSPRKADILQQELLALQEDLNRKKIIAPYDGLISQVNGVEGENYDSNREESWLIGLIDRSVMKAVVPIREREIPQIREGQTVSFRFDTLPEEEFFGSVSALSPEGKVVNGYAQMDTELTIPDPDPRIYPGYSFSAAIRVAESRELLVMPREYAQWEDDRIFVSLCDEAGTILERREVRIAPLDQERVQVLSGLQEGDRLGLPPLEPGPSRGGLF